MDFINRKNCRNGPRFSLFATVANCTGQSVLTQMSPTATHPWLR